MILIGFLLAELEEDLFKDEHRPCTAQDGEGLASKQRVDHSCHRRTQQRLNGTLEHTVGIK